MPTANACCPRTDRRGSCGLTVLVVQHPAEARATGDLGICLVVIRRSNLLSDQLAANALVKTLGQVVLHEFVDQSNCDDYSFVLRYSKVASTS